MTARTQQDRTPTNNTPPANNALLPGQLFVEMGTPLRLWTGVPTSIVAAGNKLIFDTSQSVSSFNTRTGAVTFTSADLTAAGGALLASPTFTGDPKAPTAAPGDNDTSIATTAFVAASFAPLASPTFTGNPLAPTPAPGDNDTSIATTAFTTAAVQVETSRATAAEALRAPIASPVFTGDPQAPTPAPGDADTSVATTAFVQAAVNAAASGSVHNIGRNLIHNPLFNVAQRGAGPFTTLGGYTLDRWYLTGASDTASVSQATFNDSQRAQTGDEAATYALSNTFTGNAAAGAYNTIYQGIESVRRLSGKTVTLSFWAVAVAGTPKFGINYQQSFGSGGSPSAAVWANATGQSVTLSTTWTRYSITTTIPSTAGKTLGNNGADCTYLYLTYSSGATNNVLFGSPGVQSGTINIWGVQLEIGNIATPLEKPDPRYDLSNCQRFFQTLPNVVVSGYTPNVATIYAGVVLPVTMRATPTVATSGISLGSATAYNVNSIGPGYIVPNCPSTGTVNVYSTANLAISADL